MKQIEESLQIIRAFNDTCEYDKDFEDDHPELQSALQCIDLISQCLVAGHDPKVDFVEPWDISPREPQVIVASNGGYVCSVHGADEKIIDRIIKCVNACRWRQL